MDLLSGEDYKRHRRLSGSSQAPEVPNDDFTLYFLGYDHGGNLSPEEKKLSRFTREGNSSNLLRSMRYPTFAQASLN
jgi:hypothetical protein